MAESREGNVILAPGMDRSAAKAPNEILYSTAFLFQKGGTIDPSQGDLPAGTPVKMNTSTGMYVKATASDAEGLLRLDVDASAPKKLVDILFGGIVNTKAMPKGLDFGALATTLGGKYNAGRGFLKF